MNGADTAWVLASSALVLLMTPGLAMFYGGMTRSKNVLSTMMHSFFLMGLASIVWFLWSVGSTSLRSRESGERFGPTQAFQARRL